MTGLQHFDKEQKAIYSPMFNHHSLIPWGSFRGQQEEKWGSFRGQFGDHFRVGGHFGVGIISGAVQASLDG